MLDINETSLVQVTNLGTAPLKYSYASRPYYLAPGRTVGVPYYAASLWFGNPTAIDTGTSEDRHLKHRTIEIDRLSALYGLCGAPWSTDGPFTQTDPIDSRIAREYVVRSDGQYYHPHLPNVRVTDLEGTVLPVVVMDPEGADITPVDASSKSEARATQDAISSLQQQLRSLQLQLARQSAPTGPADDTMAAGTTDTPLVAPDAPEPTAGKPTIDAPRRPGRPRKNASVV